MKNPSREPRPSGAQHRRQSSRVGKSFVEGRAKDVPHLRRLDVAQYLGNAKEAHGHHHEVEAVGQLG